MCDVETRQQEEAKKRASFYEVKNIDHFSPANFDSTRQELSGFEGDGHRSVEIQPIGITLPRSEEATGRDSANSVYEREVSTITKSSQTSGFP